MKYLRKFQKNSQFQSFKNSEDYVEPYIVYTNENKQYHYLKKYKFLTIKSLEDGLTVSFSKNKLQYSIDGYKWETLSVGQTTPIINKGEKIFFKQTGLRPSYNDGIGTFTINKKFELKGNVMSLLFGNNADKIFTLEGYAYAFKNLFKNCTTLQNITDNFLPARILSDYCYYGMFSGCNNLTIVPENLMFAKKLAQYCCSDMFLGCTNLVIAPELYAKTLSDSCYLNMFRNCRALTIAPGLPASVLCDSCYKYMFSGCINLKTTPVLIAPKLEPYCYDYMFAECSNLNYVKALFTTAPSNNYTTYWLYGVSNKGLFIKSDNATWETYGYNAIPEGWTVLTESTEKTINYCTLTALEDNLTLTFSQNELLFSLDGNYWNLLAPNTELHLDYNQSVIFKNQGLTPTINNGIGTFTVNKKFKISGNVMSLLFGDNAATSKSLKDYNSAFERLFSNCITLQSVSNNFLPATELANNCYLGMFNGCTSLVTAPELPARKLKEKCYGDMFGGCTSLVNAPELPAITLTYGCYSGMFQNCTSLVSAPELPATNLAGTCYAYMFNGCTSLVSVPNLPATSLTENCYTNMFEGCTNLSVINILPSKKLALNCYRYMFSRCSSLKNVYPTNLPATELAPYCYYGMFNGCTSLVSAPELPATTLTENCYTYMFDGCGNLNYIKALFTTEPSDSYTNDWVNDVSSTGTFVKSENAKWDMRGTNAIPEGWTVEIHKERNPHNYCTIHALEDNLTISFSKNSLQYSIDNDPIWYTLSPSSSYTLKINKNQMVQFKQTGLVPDSDGIGTFTVNRKFNLSGNVMSLLFGDNAADNNSLHGYDFVFNNLFANCTTLQSVSNNFLPATELAPYCYYNMFNGCTSLVTAPELPAETLNKYCYYNMFKGCTLLVNPPQLPATTLFEGCYDSMFINCRSLVTAPELPATTLVNYCYYAMFENCNKLNYIKALFTTKPSYYHTNNWVSNVASTGTFVKSKNAAWDVTGVVGIPIGWTVEVI